MCKVHVDIVCGGVMHGSYTVCESPLVPLLNVLLNDSHIYLASFWNYFGMELAVDTILWLILFKNTLFFVESNVYLTGTWLNINDDSFCCEYHPPFSVVNTSGYEKVREIHYNLISNGNKKYSIFKIRSTTCTNSILCFFLPFVAMVPFYWVGCRTRKRLCYHRVQRPISNDWKWLCFKDSHVWNKWYVISHYL